MNFLRFWFPLIAYSGIIFYVSSQSSVPTPQTIPHFDKICHLAEYTIFGFLLARIINYVRPGLNSSTFVLLTAIGAGLYGVTDEIHQSFVPGRTASIWDVFADTIGGCLGGLTYIFFRQLLRKDK